MRSDRWFEQGRVRRELQRSNYWRRKRDKAMRFLQKENAKDKKKAKRLSRMKPDVEEALKSSRELRRLKECFGKDDVQIRRSQQEEVLKVPEEFCFSHNPDQTIEFLRKVYQKASSENVTSICIDYTSCKILGVCASTIMDIIMMECYKGRKLSIKPLTVAARQFKNGMPSKSPEVNKLLKASGLYLHMGERPRDYSDVEKLELIKNGESSRVAEKIIEYIDRSLQHHGLVLTKEGKNYLGQLLGEIADNCKQHGGDATTWYTLGHYYQTCEEGMGKCKLVIMDFGDTIYESLKNKAPEIMKKKIFHYVRRSKSKFKTRISEETLFTLYSLQQRVSRLEQKDIVRGNGTITFLNAFQELFATNRQDVRSLLSITSGRCSILFDGTYLLKEEIFSEKYKNRVIAFNKNNSLIEDPDQRYVRTLKNSFPGTVISMELYIDDKMISRKEM